MDRQEGMHLGTAVRYSCLKIGIEMYQYPVGKGPSVAE